MIGNRYNMSKTLTLRAVIISLILSTLMTGIHATTFARVALAQGNFTTPTIISNSQSVSHSNGTAADTNATSPNFITYENSTWGIKIQYPSSWEKQTSGQGVTFALLPNDTNGNSHKNMQHSWLSLM